MRAPKMTNETPLYGLESQAFCHLGAGNESCLPIGRAQDERVSQDALDHTPPTLRDVAQRAGVSAMTVSRTINQTARVSPRTQQAVERAIVELGYVLNSSAQTLARRQTNRILIVFDESFVGDGMSPLLLAAVDECSRRNLQLLTDQNREISALLERARTAAVKGVIIAGSLPMANQLSSSLLESGVPVVAISSEERLVGAASISIDNRRAAFDMTNHLMDLGHSRIGFLAGPSHHLSAMQRLAGYRDAVELRQGTIDSGLIEIGDLTYRSGLIASERLLDLPEPPTAIFASTDPMAAGALSTAHQRQICVPADLTICGFDDTPLATLVWPRLTTIAHPIKDMIREAIGLLTRTEPHEFAQEVRVPHRLIRRQSDSIPRY